MNNFVIKALSAIGLAQAAVIELSNENTPQMALPSF